MDSSQLLCILLALASASHVAGRPMRPNPNLSDEEYEFMRATDFFGHKSFLLGDSLFHNFLLFVGFVVLMVIRNLSISMTAFSTILFLISLFYKRFITHASYTLVMSLVLLANDAMVNILCLVISVLDSNVFPPVTSSNVSYVASLLQNLSTCTTFCSDIFSSWIAPSPIYILVTEFISYIASWSFCSTILDFVARSLGFFLSMIRYVMSPTLEIVKDSFSERVSHLCILYGSLAVLNVFLILACLCMLSKIRRSTTKIFYLRESYRFYVIFSIVRFATLFRSSLSLAGVLSRLGGSVGKHTPMAALLDVSLCILVCCTSHFVFTTLSRSAKRVSIEK